MDVEETPKKVNKTPQKAPRTPNEKEEDKNEDEEINETPKNRRSARKGTPAKPSIVPLVSPFCHAVVDMTLCRLRQNQIRPQSGKPHHSTSTRGMMAASRSGRKLV